MSQLQDCPICYNSFTSFNIENHVNECLLFSSKECKMNVPEIRPLLEKLKPKSFKEFYGHSSLIANNTFLKQTLSSKHIPNVIFWGPPGCGKTSLVNVIIETSKVNANISTYFTSAVNFNINAVYIANDNLKKQQELILIVDQIHWLDKKQQNQILVLIRNYNLTLIGTTTENPSFNLSESFLNVCRVMTMQKLKIFEVKQILENAAHKLNVDVIDDENTLINMFRNKEKKSVKKSTLKWLAEDCDGDARIALNNFELILQERSETAVVKNQIKKSHFMYDRNGEEHHNIISAMHESIKAYNDNATMYWMTRMLLGGENLQFIARRLVRAASEDTGNKDINALRLTVSAMQACSFLDVSDSEVVLAQCAIYLARAPKSKEAYTGLTLAKQAISKYKDRQPAVLPDAFKPLGLENVNFL